MQHFRAKAHLALFPGTSSAACHLLSGEETEWRAPGVACGLFPGQYITVYLVPYKHAE